MKILIVDDKEESRYLLETLLEGSGYTVDAAAHGKQALEKLQAGGFDLIISDILMPKMDGFQLCRKINADQMLCRIPIIIYTATYTGQQDEQFALKIGAKRFIRKPSDPEELLEAIRNVMEAAGTEDEATTEPPAQEEEILKLYNERLVRKLEKKMLEAEREAQARKEAEDELRISNTRLQLALAASNIGLWDWDLETDEVHLSPEWKHQIGYEDHEIPDHYEEWESRIHPEDKPGVLAEQKAYLEGHKAVYNMEFRFRHKNGSYRWITSYGKTIPGPDVKPGRMTGCHGDITEARNG